MLGKPSQAATKKAATTVAALARTIFVKSPRKECRSMIGPMMTGDDIAQKVSRLVTAPMLSVYVVIRPVCGSIKGTRNVSRHCTKSASVALTAPSKKPRAVVIQSFSINTTAAKIQLEPV